MLTFGLKKVFWNSLILLLPNRRQNFSIKKIKDYVTKYLIFKTKVVIRFQKQIVLFTNSVFWFCFSTDLLQFKDLVFRVFILKLLCFVLFFYFLALFERNNNNNHLPEPRSVFWHLIENPFFLSLSVSLSVSLL
jgi:hypothetical protein